MAAALMQQARKAIREGQLVEARSLLRQVINDEPKNHAAWLLLARATPDKKLASQYIDRARHLQPDSPLVQRAQDDLASNKTAATNKFSYGWLLLPILTGLLLVLSLVGINYLKNTSQQPMLKSFESVDRVAAAPAEAAQEEPTRVFGTNLENHSEGEVDSPQITPPARPEIQRGSEEFEKPRETQGTFSQPVVSSDSDRGALPAAILMGIEKESASSESAPPSEEAYPISTPPAEDVTVEKTNTNSSSGAETLDASEDIDTSDLEETANIAATDVPAAEAGAPNDTITDIEQETQYLEEFESEEIKEDNTGNSATPSERWIDVNLTTQTLTAYEGETPVLNSLISSGMWQFPTVTGEFHTWIKYESQHMTGYHLGYNYDLPNVPHVMYFFKDYAIHGAYWHNNFGTPMSHGCVNVNLVDAEWLYNWAPLGTLVSVHY
jgi:lipoprotein-anchoring transpeptidase ErfK/SrfK